MKTDFFGVITITKYIYTLEKCKKEFDIVLIILVQGFCPLKINITRYPDGFRLNTFCNILMLGYASD